MRSSSCLRLLHRSSFDRQIILQFKHNFPLSPTHPTINRRSLHWPHWDTSISPPLLLHSVGWYWPHKIHNSRKRLLEIAILLLPRIGNCLSHSYSPVIGSTLWQFIHSFHPRDNVKWILLYRYQLVLICLRLMQWCNDTYSLNPMYFIPIRQLQKWHQLQLNPFVRRRGNLVAPPDGCPLSILEFTQLLQ